MFTVRRLVVLCLVLIVASAILPGCGGGGGGAKVVGDVYLSSSDLHPKLAIADLDAYDNWHTHKCVSLSRPSSGWDYSDFECGCPTWSSGKAYAIIAFDDYNGDNQAQDSEVIGALQGLLVGDTVSGEWYYVDSDLYYVGNIEDYTITIYCNRSRDDAKTGIEMYKDFLKKLPEISRSASPNATTNKGTSEQPAFKPLSATIR